jgi:deoxyribonuclease V
MELAAPEVHPDPGLTRERQIELQRRIAQEAKFADGVIPECPDRIVVGVDQGFTDEEAVSVAVAVQDGTVVERSTGRAPLQMPYVPGLLSFREGEAVVTALEGLSTDADVLLCDGSGRIHYRQAGLATHLGVLFDMPAVGVIKRLLCGRVTGEDDAHLEEGDRLAIEADDEVEAVTTDDGDWPLIGYAYQSRQFPNPERRHVNPLYVSPGHRVTAAQAVDIVADHCRGYKLPHPIRLADRGASVTGGKD